jgi:alkylation response protein AidB-like acyl-CoA dehydrogenase
MYPELGHGAALALEKWANDDVKGRFLAKMTDGTWGGTMCLTEAHAGTDLGMIRTRAVPTRTARTRSPGRRSSSRRASTTSPRTSATSVLAKLPGAPAGTRGISMFLVPKFVPDADGAVARSTTSRARRSSTRWGSRRTRPA